MKRGKPLKRTQMRRKAAKPKKKRIEIPGFERELPPLPKRKTARNANTEASRLFRAAAREQKVCAVCGASGSFDAHHVIEKSYLKANGLPLFHADNALRLCDEHTKRDCHGKHTRRFKRVKLTQLTEWNIRYAFYLLGEKAPGYLRRNYAGEDPRVDAMEKDLNPDE